MKINPAPPLNEEPAEKTKNRGCNATVFTIILVVLLATLVLWLALWAGGAKRAQQEPVKPTTTQPAQ